MASIPERFAALLDLPVLVYLATVNPDGSPQVSPIWAERDGDTIRFGTAEGRAKVRTLRRDPRLAMSFVDPDSPSTSYSIKAVATSIEQRGWDLIDRLSGAYKGSFGFPRIEGMVRVDIDVEPLSFHSNH